MGARCSGSRAAGSWCHDDNIIPWSAPEEWRNSWDADRLQEYEDDIEPSAYRDGDHIAEVFTSRMREIAERKEAIIRRPGSRPPWLLSKPRSLWVGGSAPDATNGTCRSVTYVTVATGSVPRRESSRAVSQTPRRV